MALSKDLKFSDLHFHEKLGEGGFSSVHRVTFKNDENDIIAAAKNVPNIDENEVDILKLVQHKNIVRLIAYIKTGPVNIMLLELAPNGSLYDRLYLDNAPISPTLSTQWLQDAANALQYLHDRDILHRDIKSKNCLLFENDLLKLADFGIARQINRSHATSSAKGTWQYMAPEIHKEDCFSKPSDIYAFGMLVYEVRIRRLPFRNCLEVYVVYNVTKNGLAPEVPASCPVASQRLMQRCWSYDSAKRPTIQQVCEMLDMETGGDGEDVKVLTTSPKKQTSKYYNPEKEMVESNKNTGLIQILDLHCVK